MVPIVHEAGSRKLVVIGGRATDRPSDRAGDTVMRIHIFRGPGRVFAFTEDGVGANLPEQYGPWTAFKSLELTRDEAQAGVNVTECLDDIERHGFHLTDAHMRITDQALR
jgi:hypothetical protein